MLPSSLNKKKCARTKTVDFDVSSIGYFKSAYISGSEREGGLYKISQKLFLIRCWSYRTGKQRRLDQFWLFYSVLVQFYTWSDRLFMRARHLLFQSRSSPKLLIQPEINWHSKNTLPGHVILINIKEACRLKKGRRKRIFCSRVLDNLPDARYLTWNFTALLLFSKLRTRRCAPKAISDTLKLFFPPEQFFFSLLRASILWI